MSCEQARVSFRRDPCRELDSQVERPGLWLIP